MPLSDYKLWLFGKAVPTVGVDFMHAGNEYTYTAEDVIDFGLTYPNISKADKAGLHVVINEAFSGGGFTGCEIWIVMGSGATPTTKVSGRYIAVADMTAGKHFFIPLAPITLLEFVAAIGEPAGGNPTAGQLCMWIGPDEDGTE